MSKNNQKNEANSLIHIGQVIQNNSNGDATEENQKLIIDLLKGISIYGDKEKFLEEYFGENWKEDLVNPETYKNLKKLLNNTAKTLLELRSERKDLLEKIKLQRLHSSLQSEVEKAIMELRYEDARKLLDSFLTETQSTIEDSYKAHYQKALIYVEQMSYFQAKDEIEYIPTNKIFNVKILIDYAQIYQVCGNNQEALFLLKRILQINEHASEIDDFSNIEPHIALSNLYIQIGLFNEAQKHCDILFKISEIEYKDGNLSYLGKIYSAIGDLYLAKGDYQHSEYFYNKSINIDQSIPADEEQLRYHYKLKVADTCSKLSDLYRIVKLFEEAEEKQSWSVIVKKGILGENNLSLAHSYNNFGLLYTDMADFEKADKYYQKALEIRIRLLGEEHYRTATVYSNMALMLQNKTEYEKSEKLHKKALGIYKKTLGEEHPYVANVYSNLAMLHHISDWGSQIAYDYMLKAIEIRCKVLPENHSDLIYSKTWIKAIKAAVHTSQMN